MASSDPIIAGMPGRYATALFELAEEAGQLDNVASDLTAFEDSLNDSDDLSRLVRSPAFSAEQQARALGAILEAAGASELTRNFMLLITRNRRLFAVRGMIRAFRALLAEHRGELTADVTSAQALNDEQTAALKQTLKTSMGRDVQINTAVDPSLLGGLIVKIGSRMIDSSLRTKLNNLKVAMKEVG